jgi:methylmalonyl-CoA mutase
MSHDLELYPFVKQNPRKTLIIPIIEKRLAENLEKERLSQENQS